MRCLCLRPGSVPFRSGSALNSHLDTSASFSVTALVSFSWAVSLVRSSRKEQERMESAGLGQGWEAPGAPGRCMEQGSLGAVGGGGGGRDRLVRG